MVTYLVYYKLNGFNIWPGYDSNYHRSEPNTLHPGLTLLENACNATTHDGAYDVILVKIHNHDLHHDKKSLQVTGTSEHRSNLKIIRRESANKFCKTMIILMVTNANDVCKINALLRHTDLNDTTELEKVLNECETKPRRAFIYNVPIRRELVTSNGGLNCVSSQTGRTCSCALLPSNLKTSYNKYTISPSEYWPHLVLSSGCTIVTVDAALSDLERRKFDAEYIRRVSEAYEHVPDHTFCGYALLKKEDTNVNRHITTVPEKMSICFYFGGCGAQWIGMGNSLKNLPVFWNTIQRRHDILKPKGFDLIHVITDDNPKIFDPVNFINAMVGQAAMQIALCDVLKSVGIVPDYIYSSSLGEIPSGYADGCLTKEEAILISYYCALAAEETQYIPTSKMFVGIDCNSIHQILPPEIDVANYFGPGGCIICGPTETVRNHQEFLRNRGIYYKEPVPSLYPTHTSYFSPSRARMINLMKTVITEPKLRSKKWISNSTLETEWSTEVAMNASAEYYTNFVHNPLYFHQAIQHLPKDVVLIDLAPHDGCTQKQLQLAEADMPTIPLMRKNCDNGVEFLSCALGKMYQTGVSLQVNKLYPFSEVAINEAIQNEHST